MQLSEQEQSRYETMRSHAQRLLAENYQANMKRLGDRLTQRAEEIGIAPLRLAVITSKNNELDVFSKIFVLVAGYELWLEKQESVTRKINHVAAVTVPLQEWNAVIPWRSDASSSSAGLNAGKTTR